MRGASSGLSLLLLVAVHTASAGAAPLRLSIEEAVSKATAASLDLRANRKDISVAEANVERSRALLPANPFFSAGAQHAAGFSPNYSFSLSQEFEVAGQRRRRMSVAEQDVEKATWDVKTAEHALAATVKTAFIHALISSQRVAVAQQGIDAAADLAGKLQSHTHPSDAQHIDFNQAHIQEIRARRELAQAEQTRDNALGALRRLLAVPFDQDIELTGAPQSAVQDLPSDADLIDRALHTRPDLAALRRAVERADMQMALTKTETIPNVTLTGIVSRFEGDTLAGGDVGVPIPVFQRKTAEVHEAAAEHDRSSLQVQDLEREIEKEVREARRACVVAAGDLQALQHDIVPKSEENSELERRLYDRGDVTVAELVGLQVDLLTARRDYLEALETYNTALIELNRVAGGGVTP